MQRLHNGNKLAHINSTLAYGYDANGNMNYDGRKNIDIEYNLLNLPHTVSENSTVKATYTYLADGTKLSTITTNVILIPNIIMQINGFMYFGSMVYKIEDNNFGLESTSFGGGRINATSNDYEIDYFITDHLGSTRVIVDNAGNIKEQNDYYPFGMRHENSLLMVSTNRWEFGGKEKQTLDNMGWLDFMARMLSNCEIPMFTTQDPLQEKFPNVSSYLYCGNQPINRVDPDGMEWKTTKDEDIAKEIQRNLATEVKSLDKTAISLQKDIDKIKNNTKLSDEKRTEKIAKKESQLAETNATKDYIEIMSTQIGALGESSTIYSFNNLGENASIGYLSSPKEGEIVINYVGGVNSFGNQTHETVHATQYERGLFTRNPLNPEKFKFKDNNYANGAELSAYISQYIVAPKSLPFSVNGNVRSVQDINLKWLRGILGTDGKPIYQ